MLRDAEPRWSSDAPGLTRPIVASVEAVSTAPTLFRLWASGYTRPGRPNDPDASPGAPWREPLPFTEAAQQARASFDPAEENRKLGCTPKEMPVIMNTADLWRIVEQADTILLRNEEYDTVRTIHMDGCKNAEDGEVVVWGFELSSPTTLLRRGWSRRSLESGDVITVSGAPARNHPGILLAHRGTGAEGNGVLTGITEVDQADRSFGVHPRPGIVTSRCNTETGAMKTAFVSALL